VYYNGIKRKTLVRFCLLPNGTVGVFSKLPYHGGLVCSLMNILAAALTPNSENSLILFPVCCDDLLISFAFAKFVCSRVW
jgi:hypothetical protein